MELSRLFATGEAECSEFRLTTGFDFERKTEGTNMELSRLFATGEAECSEFRLTTARGLAKQARIVARFPRVAMLGLVCF